MSYDWRYILGIGTLVGVVGLTVYAIKKSKDLQKSEGGIITVEEAKAEVEAYKRKQEERLKFQADIEEVIDEIDEGFQLEETPLSDEFEDVQEDMYSKIENDYEQGKGIFDPDCEHVNEEEEDYDEEDYKLRHDPNSIEARRQFIRMELAEWTVNDDAYHTMVRLFDFPINPQNDGDHILYTQIIDYKVQFFGFGSKWVKEISLADVILHYARGAYFNYNESVRYWTEYFLQFNELHHTIPSHVIDETINKLDRHKYYNARTNTHSLFGLTPDYAEDAIIIAERNIDKSVTYDIEFNQFLKSYI